MVRKLGFFDAWLGGDTAQHNAINENAEALESIDSRVSELQAIVERQANEIVQLRATIMGLAEVVQRKTSYDDGELDQEIKIAYEQLVPKPKPTPVATDPYRGVPAGDPTPSDIEAAKKLMKTAENHHFSKQFAEARAIYEEVVTKYGNTKQANQARQQLANLKGL